MTHWLHVLHVFGVIFWIGGVVAVSAVAMLGAKDASTLRAARSVTLRLVAPGLVCAWVGGLTMLALGWGLYARAGWMHGKVTLALVAAALTGVLSGKLRRAAAGADVAPGTLRGLAIAIAVLATLVIVLAKLGPVWMPATPG